MWKSEAEPGDGKTPGIDNANTGQFYDSRWLYSTDFIKIKNITLGYRLPFKKKFIQNARVYLSGENLLMWDKYDGGFSAGSQQRRFKRRLRLRFVPAGKSHHFGR